MEKGHELTVGTGLPRWACRWRLKSRHVESLVEPYCPWWAIPLDALHRLIFGSCDVRG